MRFFIYLNKIFLAVLLLTAVGCKKNNNPTSAPKGNKSIHSDPEGATIIYNGKELGKTPYTITAKPKSYIIKLSKTGYRTRYASFTVVNGKNKASKFKLEPISNSVLIDSKPQKATVVFNGKRIAETPCVLPDMPFGTHSVRLESSGYASKDLTFNVTSERPLKVTAELESNIGQIFINSNPQGAKVIINGKNVGITPYRGDHPDGTYTITLQRSDYLELNTTIAIKKGKKISKNYKLHLRPGSFKIITDPAGAKVHFGGKYVGKTPVVIPEITANQEHQLTISLDGFAPISKKVKTSPGHQESLVFDMKRNSGDLELVINPPGVTVYIDGKKYAVTEKADTDRTSKIITIKNLLPGKHVVRYTHRRAVPTSRTKNIEIIAGEVTRPAPMKLWVPNAEITYIDDAKETVILLSEDSKGVFVEPQNGIRYTVLRSKIKKINYFKDKE